MARVDNGILTLTELEATEIAMELKWKGLYSNLREDTKAAMLLVAEQLTTLRDRDPFLGRRFVVEVEQDVKRC